MNPGVKRHIVTIQSSVDTPDGYGSSTRAWSEYVSLWAEIWAMKVQEVVVGGKITPISRFTVRTSYRPGITEKMRITKGSDIYDILGIRNIDERNITLEFLCSKNG